MADHRDAIEALFRRHARGVGGFVLARVGDPELAEELTARVFLQVVRKFHQLRGPPAAWLWAVVRSELARHFRDARPAEPLPERLPDPGELPPGEAQRREAQVALQAALAKLPEQTQQLVYLKFFLDLPHAEIAEATGLTVSNVGVRLFRAMRDLRALLGEPGPNPTELSHDRPH